MKKFVDELSKLFANVKGFAFAYHEETDFIWISSYDCLIHGDVCAQVFSYCADNSLRCFISYSPAVKKLSLTISKY